MLAPQAKDTGVKPSLDGPRVLERDQESELDDESIQTLAYGGHGRADPSCHFRLRC